jgi:hypothetical protein
MRHEEASGCHVNHCASSDPVEPNYSDPEASATDLVRNDLRSIADSIVSVASGSGPFPEPHRVYL